MLTRFTIAIVGWLALSAAAVACINTYGTDLHGNTTEYIHEEFGDLAEQLRRSKINRDQWLDVEQELAAELATGDFKHRSDYAAALIYLGRYDEAILILEEVERQQPGEYIVATNLGTAYELNGDLERALVWIETGFERNPLAHGGSEWLHVKILQARIALAADPQWFESHSVLGIDLGREAAPIRPLLDLVDSQGGSHDLFAVRGAVEYQLQERMQFVSPPDAVVADLLFDLGNLLALTSSVEQAVPVFQLAQEYGVADPTLLHERIEHFEQLAAANPRSGERVGDGVYEILMTVAAWFVGLLTLGGLVIVTLTIVAYRRYSRRKSYNGDNRQGH